jgi:hypothetical protein
VIAAASDKTQPREAAKPAVDAAAVPAAQPDAQTAVPQGGVQTPAMQAVAPPLQTEPNPVKAALPKRAARPR